MNQAMSTNRTIHALALGAALLLGHGATAAIEVDDLGGFEEHFGRYAPDGDCARQPQIVVAREGFSFEGGPPLPKATRPDYAASFMGNYYQGISLTFFPYTEEPRPILMTFNADEKPGVLTVGIFDFDYPGGPKLPPEYRPYVDGSPYLRCR